MSTWYCLECGHYVFSVPGQRNQWLRNVWNCSLCQNSSVVELGEPSVSLLEFVSGTRAEWPSGRFDDPKPEYRPLNYVVEALAKASLFIHVATESIDGFFLGMLSIKQFEPEIEQRVILWHPRTMYQDLGHLMDHSKIVKGYEHRERPLARGLLVMTISRAHQKLIVVDGCIAFKGSANATLDGWTEQGNLIEFVTDRRDIQELNQTYFAEYTARKRAG